MVTVSNHLVVSFFHLSSDGNEYLSTSSQVDSMLDDSTRIDPDCASLSSQNSFSKEDGVLNGTHTN